MFALTTQVHVAGLSGREVTDFLSTCDEESFRRWWPGTHLHFRTLKGEPGSIGSVFFMEEMIGARRVKIRCEVVDVVPGRSLVWQVRRPLFRLPVKLILRFADDDRGTQVEQSIEAGLAGVGRFLDPLFRLLFPPSFAAAKDGHVRTEFPRLRDMLRQEKRQNAPDRHP
jgi:hypothetical protein